MLQLKDVLKSLLLTSSPPQLGQRKGFSDTDIRKLNTLYKCKGYPQVAASRSGQN